MFKQLGLVIPFEFHGIHPEFFQERFEAAIKLPAGTVPLYSSKLEKKG